MLAVERPRVPAESVLRSVLLDEQSRGAQAHPHPAGVADLYVLKKQKESAARSPSPLGPLGPHGERLVARPQTKPQSVAAVDWARSVLGAGGVLAAVPACGARGGVVALDGNLASGNAAYWATQLLECADLFRTAASTECMGRETVAVTAVTLQKVPDFLPEGDVYGRPLDQLDRFSDAGLRVSVQRRPYWTGASTQLRDVQEQELACAREAVHTLREAERGVAPCVLAMFCSGGDRAQVAGEWRRLRRPNMAAVAEVAAAEGEPVENLVTVQQVSTFSLADVMSDLREAQSQARREQLKSVLRRACEMALEQTFQMCEPHEGFGIAKLNMMPETVVFCPELVASGSSWTLEGIGHRPMSDEHLDGVAKLTGFDALLTSRVPESHYSVDTSFLMHSLLLLAFSHAQFGRQASSVMWDAMLSAESQFVRSARAVESRATNMSSFLASIAATRSNGASHETELNRATAEVASDLNTLLSRGLLSGCGKVREELVDTRVFARVVGMATGSSQVDTRVFAALAEPSAADEEERLCVRALRDVKQMRAARLRRG